VLPFFVVMSIITNDEKKWVPWFIRQCESCRYARPLLRDDFSAQRVWWWLHQESDVGGLNGFEIMFDWWMELRAVLPNVAQQLIKS
jgi:hypothetical protein